MWHIAIKELMELLYSPKFLFAFMATFILICASLFNGYALYEEELNFYEAEHAKAREDMAKSGVRTNSVYLQIHRKPSELSIFDLGTHGVVGRQSRVRARAEDARGYYYPSATPYITNDLYSDNPVLALFGDLNLTFVAATVLSLFAILLSYNSVCGEREDGTLALVLSNSVRRSSIFFAKLFSGFVTSALLFLLPFIAGLSGLLILTDIVFTPAQWGRIALMAGTVCLYLWLFQVIGIGTSTLVRSSFLSFLICLLIWIAVVALLPRLSMQTASVLNPPMSREEVNTRSWMFLRDIFRSQQDDYFDFIENNVITKENYREKMQEYRKSRYEATNEARERYNNELWQEYVRRRTTLAETATSLSRISPYPCLVFTIHTSTGTGHDLLARFERAIEHYNNVFEEYGKKLIASHKEELERRNSGRSWEYVEDSAGFMRVKLNEENDEEPPPLDVGLVPKFDVPLPDLPFLATEASLNLALIFFYAVIYMLVGYVAFLRYDVRP